MECRGTDVKFLKVSNHHGQTASALCAAGLQPGSLSRHSPLATRLPAVAGHSPLVYPVYPEPRRDAAFSAPKPGIRRGPFRSAGVSPASGRPLSFRSAGLWPFHSAGVSPASFLECGGLFTLTLEGTPLSPRRSRASDEVHFVAPASRGLWPFRSAGVSPASGLPAPFLTGSEQTERRTSPRFGSFLLGVGALPPTFSEPPPNFHPEPGRAVRERG